jgi:hypothetical protein
MLNVVKHLIADMQFRYAKFANRSFPPSAKQLRAKAGRTMVALSVGRGIGNFAEARDNERTQRGKRFQPVVLSGLQGKGPVRQRSLFADLIFGYFVSRQSNSPPRQLSGSINSGTPSMRDAEINSA